MFKKINIKRKGVCHCIYIDFHKAFGKTYHTRLFGCLEKKEIHGEFIITINYLYTDLCPCVELDNGVTDFFQCNMGTHQAIKYYY